MGLGTEVVMHNFVLLYCSGRIFMHMLVLFLFFRLNCGFIYVADATHILW